MFIRHSIVSTCLALALFASAAAGQERPQVTLVTLQMKQALPEEIFANLAKQAGVIFHAPNNLWDQDALQFPMDVDIQNKPFWEAVMDLNSKLNLQVSNWGGGSNTPKNRITLQQQGQYGNHKEPAKLPMAASNGMVVQATQVSFNQSIHYSDPDNRQSNGSIQCAVFVDPVVRVVNFLAPRIDEATDDKGNSLVPDARNRNISFGSSRERTLMYTVSLPLKRADQPGTKLNTLKFNLQCRVVDKAETVTFDKLSEPAKEPVSAGPVKVQFMGLKKSGEGENTRYELKIAMSREDENSDAWNILQNGQLLDESGRPFNFSGGGGGGRARGGLSEYTINYSGEGAPTKWVAEIPTQTRVLRIPFELKDLPLPQ